MRARAVRVEPGVFLHLGPALGWTVLCVGALVVLHHSASPVVAWRLPRSLSLGGWPVGTGVALWLGVLLREGLSDGWLKTRGRVRGATGEGRSRLLRWVCAACIPGTLVSIPVVLWSLLCWAAVVSERAGGTVPALVRRSQILGEWLWPIGVVVAFGCGCRLAVWWVRRRAILQAKARIGLCARCGYELSGVRDRCPECGLAFEATSAGSTSG